jgi:hypothetical protein
VEANPDHAFQLSLSAPAYLDCASDIYSQEVELGEFISHQDGDRWDDCDESILVDRVAVSSVGIVRRANYEELATDVAPW